MFFPLEQFELDIVYMLIGLEFLNFFIFNVDLAFCQLIFIVLLIVLIIEFSIWGLGSQLLVVGLASFVHRFISQQLTSNFEFVYLFLCGVFSVIFLSNSLGMIPGSFCLTAQLVIAFFLSLSVFLGSLMYNFRVLHFYFLWHFVPKNVPVFLVPFLTCIELISYFSRLFSLAIRLFANMVAGHSLLYILSNATISIFENLLQFDVLFVIFVIFPLGLTSVIYLLELGIAFLQAYVFLVLSLIYLKEILTH
jgi:ATP synthase subunit 6